MEGDLARLPDILELARAHDAIVIVDDSHGTGVMGKTGRGVAEHFGAARRDRRHHQHAGQGAGRRGRRLRRRQRSGLRRAGPALAPAALLERAAADGRLQRPARGRGPWQQNPSSSSGSAPTRATSASGSTRPASARWRARRRSSRSSSATRRSRSEISERLLEEGVFVTGFGYPVVPEGTARIRVQMSAALEPEHLDRAVSAFEKVGQEAGLLVA